MTAPAGADRSKAACDYINTAIAGLTKLNTEVCDKKDGYSAPVKKEEEPVKKEEDPAAAAAARKTVLEGFLTKIKSENPLLITRLDAFAVEIDLADNKISVKGDRGVLQEVLADESTEPQFKTLITNMLGEKIAGGRRGKRSARKGRKSFKGGRRSRKGKGSKGRRSRSRTIKGGAKMGKELQAWMKRQKAATGIAPISKKTIAATKTKSQATGSEQRSDSGKHVEATKRKF
jgi:hypothetical protein